MHYFIYPTKDATIYENTASLNTGLDEQLELLKLIDSTHNYASRILLHFDITPFQQITGSRFYLNLYSSWAENIPLSYSIYAYPISQSWDMGTGKFYSDPIISNGVTWESASQTTVWTTSSGFVSSSYVTNLGGGNWYVNYSASQSFNYQLSDIKMDVTNIVNSWLSGSIVNNGIIIKHSDFNESSSAEFGKMMFFSKDTHTIYIPTLEAAWDDSINTGSLQLIPDSNVFVTIKNGLQTYQSNSTSRFYVFSRPAYPSKTFTTASAYMVNYLIPTASYSIKDVDANFTLIDFSSTTLLSSDSSGNYFDLNLLGYQPERWYSISVKTIIGGVQKIFSNVHTFKVIQ